MVGKPTNALIENNFWQRWMQQLQLVEKPNPRSPRSKRSQSWWRRRWRYFYKRLLRLQGSPKAIARGFAVGTFAGLFPLFGLQTVIGVLLAAFLRGNKFAAAAGTLISNPLTYVPIYIFNFKVGQWLLGWETIPVNQVDWQSFSELMQFGSTFAWTLVVGCFVVGLTAAISVYFLSLWLIPQLRSLRQSKRVHTTKPEQRRHQHRNRGS